MLPTHPSSAEAKGDARSEAVVVLDKPKVAVDPVSPVAVWRRVHRAGSFGLHPKAPGTTSKPILQNVSGVKRREERRENVPVNEPASRKARCVRCRLMIRAELESKCGVMTVGADL